MDALANMGLFSDTIESFDKGNLHECINAQ